MSYNTTIGTTNDGSINGFDGAGEGFSVNEISEQLVHSDDDEAPDSDYDPYVNREVEHPLTNLETFIHLLKIALGIGIFAMPNAFKSAGYLIGFIGTIVIGALATYCVHMLVNVHYILCKKKKVPTLTYPLVAEAALLAGPKCFHKLAPFMVQIVNVFIYLCEIGACCIYIVFIATNVKQLTDHFLGSNIDIRLIMLILLLPLILINWIRNLKYMAPLSIMGNIATIASLGIICYYIFRDPLSFDGKHANGDLRQYPLFFCTILFALEAIVVILPMENEMKSPKAFIGGTGVLNRAMFIVIAVYAGLGLCGYLKYGDKVVTPVTLNLPADEIPAQVAKLMISCGILFSYAVVTQVVIVLAWNQFFVSRLASSSHKLLWEYVFRTTIVCITFLLAVAIPNLELFISLIGALTLSTLGLTIPAFLELCTRWHSTSGLSRVILIAKNVLIAVIGLAGLIIGMADSLVNIYKFYFH